jgi:hypothetical protein
VSFPAVHRHVASAVSEKVTESKSMNGLYHALAVVIQILNMTSVVRSYRRLAQVFGRPHIHLSDQDFCSPFLEDRAEVDHFGMVEAAHGSIWQEGVIERMRAEAGQY